MIDEFAVEKDKWLEKMEIVLNNNFSLESLTKEEITKLILINVKGKFTISKDELLEKILEYVVGCSCELSFRKGLVKKRVVCDKILYLPTTLQT